MRDHNLEDRVMYLNSLRIMDREEQRKDLRYGLVLCMFFLGIPLTAGTAAAVFGGAGAALALSGASIGTGLWIGLRKRRKIIDDFLSVPHGELFTDVKDFADGSGDVLVIPVGANPESLHFLYNWLCARKTVEKGKKVTVLQKAGEPVMYVPIRQLALNEGNTPQFYRDCDVSGVQIREV